MADGLLPCPLHDWAYGGDGRCAQIPASPGTAIPPFACQTVYPTVEMGGHVVFYNAPAAPFAMPFYEGRSVAKFEPAEPFDIVIDAAWYMIGANGFDVQHFRVAHDWALAGEPVVDAPAAFARRMVASYDVAGGNLRNRFTRRVAGPRVRMTVTSWRGRGDGRVSADDDLRHGVRAAAGQRRAPHAAHGWRGTTDRKRDIEPWATRIGGTAWI